MSCGVYQITNTITGESYIGSSKNIEKRFKQHRQKGYWCKRPNSLLYKAFQKYSLENFKFEIIGLCEESELFEKEDFFIKSRKPVYNELRAQHNTEKSRKEWYANYHNTEAYKTKLEKDKQWRKEHLKSRNN